MKIVMEYSGVTVTVGERLFEVWRSEDAEGVVSVVFLRHVEVPVDQVLEKLQHASRDIPWTHGLPASMLCVVHLPQGGV